MARFVFRLQRVLEQREREEQDRRSELAREMRAHREIAARLRELQGRLRDERATLACALGAGGRVALRDAREQAGVSLHLERLIREGGADLAVAEGRCDTARARLASATARRRAVELIRERRMADWARDQRRREAAVLDDLINANRRAA